MEWRNRRTFWALTAAILAILSVPSVELASSLRDYFGLARVWEPAPLKPTRPARTPHETPRPTDAAALRAVEFRLKAKSAKAVELVGDFNAWKPGLLKMKKEGGGVWVVSVPMAPGAHKYLFLVDGEPTVDPSAKTADGPEGRRVSVRRVK